VTDAAVTSAVKTKFLADTSVAGLQIDVDTNAGIVTLGGSVATKTEADRAVSLARETDGVKSVVNNLRIGR
jgi:hyperosmotically inducible protein